MMVLVLVPVVSFANAMFPPPPIYNITVTGSNSTSRVFVYKDDLGFSGNINPYGIASFKVTMGMGATSYVRYSEKDNLNNFCIVYYSSKHIDRIQNYGQATCQGSSQGFGDHTYTIKITLNG